ncbi:hypothetical protein [Klebsiella pneumoniae]|uniref:hypothetical protein n=1 Tax=Klebsiella pneumoniae TaxID=573 RepID=UPI00388F2603
MTWCYRTVRGIICLPPAVIDNTAAIAFRKNIALDKDLATLSQEGIFEFCREIDSHKRELDDDDLLLKELYRAKRREEFLLTAVRKKRTVVVVGETGSGKRYSPAPCSKPLARRNA